MEHADIRELSFEEIDMVSGGDQLGAGLATAALGIAIVAGPVGWFGISVAAGLSFAGGYLMGSSFN